MNIKLKKRFLKLRISALICVLFIFLINLFAYAESVESIRLLKISPQDERAIIKTPDGKMKVIKVGDVIKGIQRSAISDQQTTIELKVIEITKGRVVIEERTESGIETVIIRLEDGKQRVERIRKGGDEQPILYKPR